MNYYENQNGKELSEFMRYMNKKAWADFCKLNAFKYVVRAGKKPNNSELSDLNKFNYYINEVSKITGEERDKIELELYRLLSVFTKWKG